jgi:hypothetical protein
MNFGKQLVEEGAVSVRRNETEDNMEYEVTDYHGNRYPVSDKDELRSMKRAIETILEHDYL